MGRFRDPNRRASSRDKWRRLAGGDQWVPLCFPGAVGEFLDLEGRPGLTKLVPRLYADQVPDPRVSDKSKLAPAPIHDGQGATVVAMEIPLRLDGNLAYGTLQQRFDDLAEALRNAEYDSRGTFFHLWRPDGGSIPAGVKASDLGEHAAKLYRRLGGPRSAARLAARALTTMGVGAPELGDYVSPAQTRLARPVFREMDLDSAAEALDPYAEASIGLQTRITERLLVHDSHEWPTQQARAHVLDRIRRLDRAGSQAPGLLSDLEVLVERNLRPERVSFLRHETPWVALAATVARGGGRLAERALPERRALRTGQPSRRTAKRRPLEL